MTLRERFDFAILIAVFSSFVAALVIRLDSLLCSSVSHIRLQYQYVLGSQLAMDGKNYVKLYAFLSDQSRTVDLVSLRLFG